MNTTDIRRLRLRKLIDEQFSGVVLRLANRLDMKPPQLHRWLGGGQGMREDSARTIEDKLGLSRFWLDQETDLSLSSNTHPSQESAESRVVENVTPAPDIKGRIPLISWVRAGEWSEAVDIYEPGYAERWLPHLKRNGDHTYALRVDGDSMTAPYGKSYPDGCIIFVDPMRRSPSSGDRIIAKLEGANQVTFKTYVEDAGRRWLKPLNPQHPPIMEPFRVLGTVIGKWEDD